MSSLKKEIFEQWKTLKSLDKKVVLVFLAVAVLQTISWYYTSRKFFRANLYQQFFTDNEFVQLYEYLFWFIGDFISLFLLPSYSKKKFQIMVLNLVIINLDCRLL